MLFSVDNQHKKHPDEKIKTPRSFLKNISNVFKKDRGVFLELFI